MTNSVNPSAMPRHYALDWLRIIAFGLLIFYHIGMFYVPWGWHVKSPHVNEGPELAMELLNPWRLSLLFFISGVALRFLSDKLGSGGFARERAFRLFPVILFGMAFIVTPQTYFELRQAGAIEPDALGFYAAYIQPSVLHSVITPTWNHLWYVVYLLVYSLLLAPIIPLLRAFGDGPVGRAVGALWNHRFGWLLLVILPSLPFWAYRLYLNPHFETTHNLVWDWANHAHSLTILLVGYFAAKSPAFWRAVDRALPAAAICVTAYALVYYWAINAPGAFWADHRAELWAVRLGRISYAWAAILALLGLARRFLAGDGPVRRYLTEAIFPIYILHQTIIVVAGYYLAQSGLPVWPEFLLLLAATVSGCLLGFEIVKRVAWLRPVFGLKPKPRAATPTEAEA